MTPESSTRKTKKTRKTTKRTRSRRTAKTADNGAAAPADQPVEAAEAAAAETAATEEAAAVAEETPKSRKTSGARKRTTRRGKRTKAAETAETPGEAIAGIAEEAPAITETKAADESAAPVVESPAQRRRALTIKPVSPDAEVDESSDAIIIRFPPVAPPPFVAPTRPLAAPAASAATAVEEEEREAPSAFVAEEPAPAELWETQAEAEEREPFEEEEEAPFGPVEETELLEAPEMAPLEDEEEAEEGKPVAVAPAEAVEAEPEGERKRRRRRRGRRRRSRGGEPVAEGEGGGETAAAEVAAPPAPPAPPTEQEEPQGAPGQRRRPRRRRRGGQRERDVAARVEIEPDERTPRREKESAGRGIAVVEAEEAEEDDARHESIAAETLTEDDEDTIEAGVIKPFDEFDADEEEEAAARPAPTREMVINVFPKEECRIAILHHGQLEEIYIERASSENYVGNIYKGIVTNVEPSIQAAFVDFGLGKNGFLHISDLHPEYFPDGGGPAENVGCKIPRRSRPPIQRCLKRGQQVIVQITKEGMGTKGPTLSTYLSIPGRFLVMMPGMRRLGVSRKIEDEDIRRELRSQLSQLQLPQGMGFIARTAAQGRTRDELQSDLKYLVRLWRAVDKRTKQERPPAELYRESDLMIRTIRDLYTPEIGRIVVDDQNVARRAREFLHIFSPRAGNVVVEYNDTRPIFHTYGVEAELERLHSRHVPLKSGGSLIIEPTEALVAIDVNSGRFRTEEDAETTAFKINQEAADEIARQLRLRDLGGLIICDFIDMRQEAHKRDIERRLAKHLKEHKERAKILRMSAFGIIEMTRQRQRTSLTRSVYQDCAHCRGTGLVKTAESVALDIIRSLQLNVARDNIYLVEVTCSPDVANLLLNRKRAMLHELEVEHRRTIAVRQRSEFGLDQVEVRCWDQRGRAMPQM